MSKEFIQKNKIGLATCSSNNALLDMSKQFYEDIFDDVYVVDGSKGVYGFDAFVQMLTDPRLEVYDYLLYTDEDNFIVGWHSMRDTLQTFIDGDYGFAGMPEPLPMRALLPLSLKARSNRLRAKLPQALPCRRLALVHLLPVTARFLFPMICWGCSRISRRVLSSAMRHLPRRFPRQSKPMPRMCRRADFPGRNMFLAQGQRVDCE